MNATVPMHRPATRSRAARCRTAVPSSMRTVVIRTTPPVRTRTGSDPGRSTRPSTVRPGRRPESTYRRRRAVVGLVLAVLVAVSVIVAHDVLVGSAGDPAFAASSRPDGVELPDGVEVTVTARPGDTMWSIALEHRGPVPIRDYVDALISLNGGPSIRAGESVRLP